MSTDLSTAGISGILAAETELATVESNIANATNPNYSAESVNLAARPGLNGEGAGVDVLGVQRADAPFLGPEIAQAGSSQSFNSSYTQMLSIAEGIIAPSSGADIGQALQNLFNSFSSLAASPDDPAVRAAVLNSASAFAQLTQTTSSQLAEVASNGAAPLTSMVAQVNDATRQVAELNQQIIAAQASGGNASALMDQRDALVTQLSNLIGASADSQGNVSVGGLPLVSGTSALALTLTGSGVGSGLEIVLPNGNVQVQVSQVGGEIGGVLSGISSVSHLRSDLDNLVTSVANAIDARHQSGFGLDGSTGNPLFLVPAGNGPIAINPAITTQNLAAASSAAGVPGDGSNAAAMAALASAGGVNSAFPTDTLGQAFAQVVTQFGLKLQTAQNDHDQAAASLRSLTELKSSITGVSLNDQLALLTQYQNALQAAGRAVQASNDIVTFLIDELK
jgi:flagellar hook-associated protein 1